MANIEEFVKKFAKLAETFNSARTMPITSNTIMFSSPVFTFERLFYQNNPEETPFSFTMFDQGADNVLKEFSIDQSPKFRVINLANVNVEDSSDFKLQEELATNSREAIIFNKLISLNRDVLKKLKDNKKVDPVSKEDFKLFADGKQLLLQADDLYILGRWCEIQTLEDMPCRGVLAVNFFLDSFFRGKRESLNEIFRLSKLDYYREMLQSGEGHTFLAYMKEKEQDLVEEDVLTALFAQYILGVLYGADLGVRKNADIAILLFKHVIQNFIDYSNYLNLRTGDSIVALPQARNNLYLLETSAENVQSLCEGVFEEKNDWCAYNLFKNHKEALMSSNLSIEELTSEMERGNHCLYMLEKAEDIYKKQDKMSFLEMLELFEKSALQGHPTAFQRVQYCYKEGFGTDPNQSIEKMFSSLYSNLKGFSPKPFLAQNMYPTDMQSVDHVMLRRIPILPIVLTAIPESLEKLFAFSLDYMVSEQASMSIQTFLATYGVALELNKKYSINEPISTIFKDLEEKSKTSENVNKVGKFLKSIFSHGTIPVRKEGCDFKTTLTPYVTYLSDMNYFLACLDMASSPEEVQFLISNSPFKSVFSKQAKFWDEIYERNLSNYFTDIYSTELNAFLQSLPSDKERIEFYKKLIYIPQNVEPTTSLIEEILNFEPLAFKRILWNLGKERIIELLTQSGIVYNAFIISLECNENLLKDWTVLSSCNFTQDQLIQMVAICKHCTDNFDPMRYFASKATDRTSWEKLIQYKNFQNHRERRRILAHAPMNDDEQFVRFVIQNTGPLGGVNIAHASERLRNDFNMNVLAAEHIHPDKEDCAYVFFFHNSNILLEKLKRISGDRIIPMLMFPNANNKETVIKYIGLFPYLYERLSFDVQRDIDVIRAMIEGIKHLHNKEDHYPMFTITEHMVMYFSKIDDLLYMNPDCWDYFPTEIVTGFLEKYPYRLFHFRNTFQRNYNYVLRYLNSVCHGNRKEIPKFWQYSFPDLSRFGYTKNQMDNLFNILKQNPFPFCCSGNFQHLLMFDENQNRELVHLFLKNNMLYLAERKVMSLIPNEVSEFIQPYLEQYLEENIKYHSHFFKRGREHQLLALGFRKLWLNNNSTNLQQDILSKYN